MVVGEQPEGGGGGGGLTDTVTERCGELPPGPLHWNVKVVVFVRASDNPLPERLPLLDHGPPEIHSVAFVEPQLRVVRLLYATGLGDAERLAPVAAGGATDTVTERWGELPPGPLHWNVNVLVFVRGSDNPLPESEPL